MRHARFGEGTPPPELNLAWLCGDNHLPDSGGMLDQNYKLMMRMQAFRNIHRAVKRYYGLPPDKINSGLTDGDRIILKQIDAMGLLGGIGG